MIHNTKPHQRSLFQSSNEDRKKRDEATLQQMRDLTENYLHKMEADSRFFVADKTNSGSTIVVPRFQPNEVVLETTIGMGEFGVVLKVGGIRLGETSNHDMDCTDAISAQTPLLWLSSNQNSAESIETDQILREQLAKTCCRQRSDDRYTTKTSMSSSSIDDYCYPLSPSKSMEPDPISSSETTEPSLLVIKQIRKDLYPKKRIEAAKDLAREAKLLARLQQLYDFDDHFSTRNPTARRRNNHPNIISLRGIVSDPGRPEFGILLDRLHLTLTELSTFWKKRQELILENLATANSRQSRGTLSLLSAAVALPGQMIGSVLGATQKLGEYWKGENHERSSRVSSTESADSEAAKDSKVTELGKTVSSGAWLLLGERILALWDVSEGMAHLHRHKILYRDLKTENVGRTVRSNNDGGNGMLQNFDHREQQRMQLFDFGLAKECKPTDRISQSGTNGSDENHSDSNETKGFYDHYKLTGMTGTMRIMAPEVIKCIPYGLPVDVYSFGICMWEVFTGEVCNFLSPAEICDTKTIRPKLPVAFDTTTERGSVGMPRELQKLMQRCWHEEPRKRPSFHEISKILRLSLAKLHPLTLDPRDLRQQHTVSSQLESPKSPFSSERILGGGKHLMKSCKSCVTDDGNSQGGLWAKVPTPPNTKEYHKASTGCSLCATDLLSDKAGFWSRLEAIRAAGLLDE